eukprot:4884946-Prymnesium_polylepis.1
MRVAVDVPIRRRLAVGRGGIGRAGYSVVLFSSSHAQHHTVPRIGRVAAALRCAAVPWAVHARARCRHGATYRA